MTWFKVDDHAPQHPKLRAATVAGRALWYAAGSAAAAGNTDGIVSTLMAKDAAYLAEVDPDQAAAALVASGLWHDARTLRKCAACRETTKKLEPGSYLFHDWLTYQLTKSEAKDTSARWKMNRKRALLRDRALCEFIQERDGTLCRYCGDRVSWSDRKGAKAATYDHVDPDGWNSPENVVVACKQCNGRKRDRTPDEAGMPLLPAPHRDLVVVGDDLNRSGPNQDRSEPNPPRGSDRDLDRSPSNQDQDLDRDPTSRARHARDGTGQVGLDRDPDPGSDRFRSGPGTDGSGEVGSGEVGSGGVAATDREADDLRTGVTA